MGNPLRNDDVREALLFLRQQQDVIDNVFREMASFLHASRQVKPALRSLEQLLFAYFEKENRVLYDSIKRKAEEPAHQSLLSYYLEDFKNIKIATWSFFDAYSAGEGRPLPGSFAADFLGYYRDLIGFFKNEREKIFPLFL